MTSQLPLLSNGFFLAEVSHLLSNNLTERKNMPSKLHQSFSVLSNFLFSLLSCANTDTKLLCTHDHITCFCFNTLVAFKPDILWHLRDILFMFTILVFTSRKMLHHILKRCDAAVLHKVMQLCPCSDKISFSSKRPTRHNAQEYLIEKITTHSRKHSYSSNHPTLTKNLVV